MAVFLAVMLAADLPASTLEASSRGALALLGQMKAACGGDAWDRIEGWHESGRIEIAGRRGRFETWSDIRTLKYVSHTGYDGERQRLSGYNLRVSWLVRPTGESFASRDPGRLRWHRGVAYFSNYGWYRPDRYPASFALLGERRWEGHLYDVLRVTPEGGDSAELWVDRETRRIGRIVAEEITNELYDYRVFAGVCSPTRARQISSDPTAPEVLLQIDSVTTDPIDGAVFDPPPSVPEIASPG
jgi:hypothetical protein